jgi:uridine kinase
MGSFRPSSGCGRILLDLRLFDDETVLLASLRALAEKLGERRLLLLNEGDPYPSLAGSDLFADVIETAGLPVDLEQLESVCSGDEILIVTRQERIAAWARQGGIAVLTPTEIGELDVQLAPSSLVLKDTTSLILRAKRRKEERPFLIGINGMSNAGKSSFAALLAGQLETLGFSPTLLSLDLFAAPKKVRRAKNYPEADGHYRKFYGLDRLRKQLLIPMQAGETAIEIDAYDLDRERVVEKRQLSLTRHSMVILEGLYLYQEELFSSFDYRIYLVTDFKKSVELELEGIEGDKAKEKHMQTFLRRELAAQSIYLQQESPWKRAHLVIRDVNDALPTIESWHSDA